MDKVDQLRDHILHPIDPCPFGWEATKGIRGAVTGALNRALAQPGSKPEQVNANRHMVLAFLFGHGETGISSYSLTTEQWYCLYQWVGFWNDPVEGWLRRPEFPTEAGIILSHVLHAEQLKLDLLLEGVK